MEESWPRAEMAGVEVWDQRCRGSLERICEQVLARPEESFSAACRAGLRQAGGRIFGAPQMSVEKMGARHVEQTAQRCQGALRGDCRPRYHRGELYQPPRA
jgi:hypothetical protein